jgi:hypothetical protein
MPITRPKIDAVEFISITGQVQKPALMIEDLSRVGVDGSAYRKLQKTGKPFEMTGLRDCLTFTDAATQVATLRDKIGTQVTLIDNYGASTQAMLLDVTVLDQKKMIAAGGGVNAANATTLLTVGFRFQIPTVT